MSTVLSRRQIGLILESLCVLFFVSVAAGPLRAEENKTADGKEVIKMPTFEILDDANVGYQSLRSTTGMRTNEEVLNTPQSITIFNSDFFKDIDAFAIRDVLAYSSNISLGDGRVDTGYTIRGQTLTQYFDGFNINRPALLQDPYQFERVEVLKGGNAVLYNNPLGGGLINQVYKRPQDTKKADIGVQVGSWNRYRVEADATGPVQKWTDTTGINYRVTAAYNDMDTQFDLERYKRYFAMGSLDFKISANTSILVRGLVLTLKDESPYEGTPMAIANAGSPGGVLAFNYSHEANLAADAAHSHTTVWQLATYVTHKFDDSWSMRWAAIFYHELQDNSDLLPRANGLVGPKVPGNGVWNRDWSHSGRDQNQFNSEFNLVGDFATGPVRNKGIFGIRLTGTHSHETSQTNSGPEVTPFDYFHPTYGLISEASMVAGPSYVRLSRDTIDRTVQTSSFAQDSVKLFGDRLHLAVGGVINYSQTQRANFKPGTANTNSVDHSSRPNYSALYRFSPEFTAYASHNETDRGIPAGSQFNGQIFDRRSDEANELGFKFSLLKGNLNGSLAYFNNASNGNLVPDPDHAGFSRQSGKSKFEGYSFDFSEQIGASWKIIGGIGLMEKRQIVSDSRPEFIGRTPINTPKTSGGIYVNYTFAHAGDMLKGLRLGTGVEYQGDRFADSINSYTMKSYAALKLTAAYVWRRYRFDLVVSNLTDEQYWTYSQNSLAIGQYGADRDIRFKINRSF